jgi:hypothetical protein
MSTKFIAIPLVFLLVLHPLKLAFNTQSNMRYGKGIFF